MSGMFYVIAHVYAMKFEVCQQGFVKHGTKTHITPFIPQAPLHEHGTA
jgi:hypothetical protein